MAKNKVPMHRICTTISENHWELLKRHLEKYGTQQKALEVALEALEKDKKQGSLLSPEEQLWLRFGRDWERSIICILNKELVKELFRTADFEQFGKILTNMKIAEYQVAWYNQKPLKDCSLEEVLEATVMVTRAVNLYEIMKYSDRGSYYMLEVYHNWGDIRHSKLFKTFAQPLFEAYGVKTQYEISEHSCLIKIFKK